MHSKEYQKLLTDMHKSNKKWGSEFKKAPIPKILEDAIEKYKPKTILDFGCGKGFLTKKLKQIYPNIEVTGWDPSHGTDLQGRYDMIVSTDVLEHVEPEYLKETLFDLHTKTNIAQYHLIACYNAVAVLPDGRNAHLSVYTPDQWQQKFLDSNYKILKENINSKLKEKKIKSKTVGSILAVEYELVVEK